MILLFDMFLYLSIRVKLIFIIAYYYQIIDVRRSYIYLVLNAPWKRWEPRVNLPPRRI